MHQLGLTVTSASRLTGIPAWTLRRWDEAGLITVPRSASGYRIFTSEAIAEVRELKRRIDATGERPMQITRSNKDLAEPEASQWEFETCTACSGNELQLLLYRVGDFLATIGNISWAFSVHRHEDSILRYSSLVGAVRLPPRWFSDASRHFWNTFLADASSAVRNGPDFGQSGARSQNIAIGLSADETSAVVFVSGLTKETTARLVRLIANLTRGPAMPSSRLPSATARRDEVPRGQHLTFTITHSDHLPAIYEETLLTALELTGAPAGAIAYADPLRQMFSVRSHAGLSDQFVLHLNSQSVISGLMGKSFGLREPILLDDLTQHHSVTLDVISTEGVRAFLATPLVLKERCYGIIMLFRRDEDSFSQDDIYALTPVLAALTQAIERDKLRRQIDSMESERRRVFTDWAAQLSESVSRERAYIFDSVRQGLIQLTEDAERDSTGSFASEAVSEMNKWLTEIERTTFPGFGIVAALRDELIPRLQDRFEVEINADMSELPADTSPRTSALLYTLIEQSLEEAASAALRTVALSVDAHEDGLTINLADDRESGGEEAINPGLTEQVEQLGGVIVHARHLGFTHGLQVRIPLESTGRFVLTERELILLERLALGASNREIATHMKVSPKTVQNHLTSIYRKLGVNSRAQAISFALRNGPG